MNSILLGYCQEIFAHAAVLCSMRDNKIQGPPGQSDVFELALTGRIGDLFSSY
jgi:hypothetical protein